MKKWWCLLAFAAVGLGAAVIEAESGDLTPGRAKIAALDGASGGKLVRLTGYAEKDVKKLKEANLTVPFTIDKDGAWEVVAYCAADHEGNDSFFARVDAQSIRYFGVKFPAKSRPVSLGVYKLKAGQHTVAFFCRERNLGVDKIEVRPAKVKAANWFKLDLKPGQTEYTVTAPKAGTYWIVASTKAKIPVGLQHFATLKWDDGLPMQRRLLQANQTEKDMALDRIVLKANVPRKLVFTYDTEKATVSKLTFRPQAPVPVPAAVKDFKSPVTPPKRHPRVLVNPEALALIKERLTVGENKRVWEDLVKEAKKPYDFKIDPNKELGHDGKLLYTVQQKAFYYLVTGDETVGKEAVNLIRKYMDLVAFGNGQDICRKVGESVFITALAYDWCYPLLSGEDKQALHDRMLYFCAEMETGWPPFRQTASSGHGNEAQMCRDQLAMAIAVYDEDPVPFQYLSYQMYVHLKSIKDELYKSGRHDQGTGYGQYRFTWEVFAAFQFLRTFGVELLSKDIAGIPYYWYYLRLPDGRFAIEGDANWGWMPLYGAIYPDTLQILNAMYPNPEFKQELRRGKTKVTAGTRVLYLLTNDPALKPEDRRAEMPLSKIFRDPLPGLYLRTGWNFNSAADDAVVQMHGSKYHFRNHQHLDFGAFQIYYRGNLVTDLGQYRIYGVPYDYKLAKSSALHSLMFFRDPDQKEWKMGRSFALNTGGQDTPGWGVPDTYEKLTGNPIYHTGETPRAAVGPDAVRPIYNFMECDIAPLYPDRAKTYTRTFVFWNQEAAARPGTLLILDRFTVAKPTVKPIFQLTTIPKPVWKDNVLSAETAMYGKVGKLTMTTLVPAKATAELFTEKAAHTFGGVHIPARNPDRPEAKGTRTEISGPGNVYLHALQLHDGSLPALPVKAQAHDGVRYSVDLASGTDAHGGFLTDFGDAGKVSDTAFTVTVPRDQMRVLVLDLAPGAWQIGGGKISGYTEVAADKGHMFLVLDRGTYTVKPGKSGKLLAEPALKAAITPAPVPNQLWIDGKLSDKKTVSAGKTLLVPLTAFFKADGNTLTVKRGSLAVTMKVGDESVAVSGYTVKLPRKLDRDFLVPVSLAAALTGMDAEDSGPETGIVLMRSSDTPNNILSLTASDEPTALFTLLTKQRGQWIAHGRNVKAEVFFTVPEELSGMIFSWPHGETRTAYWRVDVSTDGKNYETVFDGGSADGKVDTEFRFAPRKVRSVRFFLKGNSSNTWNTLGGIRFIK